MWANEKCKIVALSSWIDKDVGRDILEYARNIFTISHRSQTYLITEPVIVPTKIDNVKRYIAVEPLSAIVCDVNTEHAAIHGYNLAEPIWIEAVEVFPYSRSNLCGIAKALSIDSIIKRDEYRGVPYLCIDSGHFDKEIASKIINGGIIEVGVDDRLITSSKCRLEIPVMRDWIPLFIGSILGGYTHELEKCNYTTINLSDEILTYCRAIASIDGKLVAVRIGKGYIFSASVDNAISLAIYAFILINTFTSTVNNYATNKRSESGPSSRDQRF